MAKIIEIFEATPKEFTEIVRAILTVSLVSSKKELPTAEEINKTKTMMEFIDLSVWRASAVAASLNNNFLFTGLRRIFHAEI